MLKAFNFPAFGYAGHLTLGFNKLHLVCWWMIKFKQYYTII